MITVINGNSFDVLKKYQDNSFDSVVCDPPYELTSIVKRFGKEGSAPAKEGSDGRFSRLSKGFMGHEWDGTGIQRNPEFWAEVLRVLKPGGHLLAFGGTRTYHRLACAIEDAGFNIRDEISWLYGQGFPKSHELDKEIGVGTALKPAHEPICLAQKPISEKTIIANYKKWGVGGLYIDDCRIELNGEVVPINKLENWSGFGQEVRPDYEQELNTKGRWPSNLILDEDAAEILNAQSGNHKSNFCPNPSDCGGNTWPGTIQTNRGPRGYDDYGGASRFFYVAKASKKEKQIDGKAHPTTKPIALLEYLVKLVTPKNGLVLDPFFGSGSTGIACDNLGYNCVGIDLEKEYVDLSISRLNKANISYLFNDQITKSPKLPLDSLTN
jgi:site-specific DNA-methyltransferase (adenine-specific)